MSTFRYQTEIRAASLDKVGAGAWCLALANVQYVLKYMSSGRGAESNLIILQSLVKYCRPELHGREAMREEVNRE